MRCPYCGQHDSRVKKTERPLGEANFAYGDLKRRERACRVCRRRFFTYEIHEAVYRRMLLLTEGVPVLHPLRTRRSTT